MTLRTVVPMRHIKPSVSRNTYGDIDKIFDNLFNNAIGNLTASSGSVTDFAMQMDVTETDTSYHATAELAGLSEKDIELTLDDGVLTLSGEKMQQEEKEGQTYHRRERRFGSFKRSLQLPADAEADKVKASMKNGVLLIDIPKMKETQKKAKRIDVKAS